MWLREVHNFTWRTWPSTYLRTRTQASPLHSGRGRGREGDCLFFVAPQRLATNEHFKKHPTSHVTPRSPASQINLETATSRTMYSSACHRSLSHHGEKKKTQLGTFTNKGHRAQTKVKAGLPRSNIHVCREGSASARPAVSVHTC